MKKFVTCFLALTIGLSGGFSTLSKNNYPAAIAESADNVNLNDWEYKIYDKIDGVSSSACVEIVKYLGDEPVVNIPEKISGNPVVSISGDAFSGNIISSDITIPSSLTHFGDGFLSNSSIAMITYKNIRYCRIENGELAVYEYIGKEPDIVVPETVAGNTVSRLWNSAFTGNQTIRSVRLPDTINYFGMRTFTNSSLENINIPKSLKIIPSNTFSGCNSLKNVDFNDNSIIAENAFKNTSVVLPESALSYKAKSCSTSFSNFIVSKDSFDFLISYDQNNCSYSAEISAFDPTDSDTGFSGDVIIPEQFMGIPVTSVLRTFLQDCDNEGTVLTSITYPSGVQKIDCCPLSNPSAIKSITIKAENAEICQNSFRGTGISELILNGSVTIYENAFAECENLKKIVFTGDAEDIEIGVEAFGSCISLSEMSFPDNSNININVNAFRSCSSLREFTVNGNASVSTNAFTDCGALETVSISGKADLSSNAFCDNKALTDIFVDTGMNINGCAFNGCTNLTNINSLAAFDSANDELSSEFEKFVLNSFNSSEDIGFVNLYIKSQANKIVSQYTNDDMSDIQKAKVLHDWICNKVSYDYENIYDNQNHNDGSVFMNDSTVCEGYAKGYNLLLNAAGIESVCVFNTVHEWNIIKIGGQYFHSDTTWDDGDVISYEWFLKSDSEMKAETDSHGQWELASLSPVHDPISNNELPECRYSMGDVNTDGKVSIADMVVLKRYILGNDTMNNDNYIFSDLDFDGIIDSFDLVCMRKILLSQKS